MSDKLDVTIGISADASGVEAGVGKAKKSIHSLGGAARDMAAKVGSSGKAAGAGFEAMGVGSDKAAKAVERATRSMQQQLQRQIAELQSGGKATREYTEALARMRGVDVNALRPLLDQLDQARKKTEDAKKGAEGFAGGLLSIKTAAAGLAVSLTVGAVFSRFIAESKAAEKEQAQLAAVLRSTGEAAGWSQAQLNAMADAMSSKSTFSAGAINEAQTRLLSYTNIVGKEFPRAMQAVIDMSARMGMDVKSSAETIGRALDIPSEGLTALTRQGFRFTEDQKALVKALEETGRAGEAQAIILDALESSYGGAAEAARNTFGGALEAVQNTLGSLLTADGASMGALTNSVNDLNSLLQADSTKQAFAFYIDLMISGASAAAKFAKALADLRDGGVGAFLGHAVSGNADSELVSIETKIAELTKTRDVLASSWWGRVFEADNIAIANKQLEMMEKQRKVLLDYVNQGVSGYDQMGDAAAELLAEQESLAKAPTFDGLVASALEATKSYKSKSEQMAEVREQGDKLRAALKKLEENEQGASKEAGQLRERLKGVDERLAAMAKSGAAGATGIKTTENAIKSFIKSLEAKTAAQRLEIAQGDKLTESQRLRIQLEALLADTKNKATAGQIAYAKAQLAEVEANEAWLKNTSDVEKALADMQKAREQSLRSVQESVKKLVEEAEATAYAEMHNVSLAEAVERLALARAENVYQQAVERGESQQMLDYLRREIEARKELVAATAQKAAREANKKAAEQAAKDWERTAQTIGDTLADYIMAGGKDAAQYLKRLFATLVLQPVVQTVVGGGMGVGAAGASGVAAGGAGGIASLVQQAYSAFTSPMFTNFGMGLAGNIQQLGGTLFGKGFEALGTSVTNFGNTVAQFSDAINMAGNIFGYGSALYSLSKGNYGSAIGTAAGTFLGGPIGAVLGSTLGGLLDGLFGGGRGANHSGGAYSTKGGNAAYQLGLGGDALRDFTSRGNASIANSVKGLVTTTVGAFDYLKKYSSTYKGVDVAAGFAVNPRYGDEDAYGYFRVLDKVTGQLLSNYVRRDGGLGSDTTKAWSTYSADLIKAVYGQFKKSDITGWVKDELAVLDSAASLENLTAAVQAIAVIDAAFADFAKTVDGMQDLSGAVQTVLLRTSGGIEALSANVATYYQAFYSEQERAAKTAGQLAEVLKEYGVELPTTAEQYRDLVEQQLAAGESGAELAAVLLGMSGTFKEVSDVWPRELEGLSGSVTSFFGSLKDAIKSLIDDVSDDRKSILRGTGVMTAEELRAAIGAISVIGPSLGGVDAAAADIAAKEALRQSAKSASETAAQAAAAALARMEAYRDDPTSAAAQAKALEAQREHALSEARKFEDGGMYRSYSYSTRVKWMNYWYPEAQRAQQQLNALQPALAEYNDQLAALQAEYDTAKLSAEQYAERLGDAESALRAAQQVEVQAKADYAAEMAKWIEEAGASVSKLSDLRGEVMSFYEAQAQAVQAMLASAGNIRAVVDGVRLNQLSAAQTAQELGARYAMDYSMALATTGTARAGYVDSMAGNLGALSEALRSESVTSTDWRVQTAKLLAQANKAADLLEGDAQGDNYQDVALGLLDAIDEKLSALSGVATAGENLIVQAIKEGTVNTLDGLRAVVAALKGDPVPAFAAGGLHAGGLRLVGERGPELEVTGPARYWSTSQTAAMLGGGGNSDAVVRELRELREENRAQASAIVRLQQELNRQVMRWDTQGMPREREEV